MKLSEAIRLGATLRPQTRHMLFWDGASCALGAACEAIGLGTAEYDSPEDEDPRYDALYTRFPILNTQVLNPVSQTLEFLQHAIPNLNDFSHWTREQIADWVETIEAQFCGQDGAEQTTIGLADTSARTETSTQSVEVL